MIEVFKDASFDLSVVLPIFGALQAGIPIVSKSSLMVNSLGGFLDSDDEDMTVMRAATAAVLSGILNTELAYVLPNAHYLNRPAAHAWGLFQTHLF